MTQAPPPGPPAAALTPPAAPTPRLLDDGRPLVSVGVALLATAVVLSTAYTRADGDLDWSNYAVGLVATLGLLGVAAVAYVTARSADPATDLVAWPGAFGVAGLGLMVAVAMDDHQLTAYVAGLSVVALSLAGLALTGRGPFVVTAVLGLYVTYVKVLDDVITVPDDAGDDVAAISIALGLVLFAVLVTVAGWVRADTRVLAGAVAGALTVLGFAGLTGALVLAQAFAPLISFSLDEDVMTSEPPRFDGYDNDTWVILSLSLLLMLGWAVCAALTGHVVYRILVVAIAVSVTPLATAVLSVEHPSWWGLVAGAIGGGLLLLALLQTVGAVRRRSLDAD
ncbi:hypothetical protein [Nocardioides lijunqiniae]|uniref:hypothetical protein n=1 Tax=Nocardioides lijunqiniae TaxID=2760832 RepID=UPI0018785E0B|nr:hypothetical protein [Nocardioides lijunqiniae]